MMDGGTLPHGKLDDLVCPCSARSPLTDRGEEYTCGDPQCCHSREGAGFKKLEGVPVIISTEMCDTLCEPDRVRSYVARSGGKFGWLKKKLNESSQVTSVNVETFRKLVRESSDRPRVLVIGAGEKGTGTDPLWNDDEITKYGIDIYKSDTVDLVCDAHYIPFPDEYFDGVWIQAVLEHVVEPRKVVSEIHRVLAKRGTVYSETPFMQQVHEGAYDFTRFTVLGHRYLFRDFEALEIGGNKGAEVALAWAFRYFVWAITRNRSIAKAAGVSASLALRPFASLVSARSLYDSPSGTFFLGRKSDQRVAHKDIVALYKGQF